MFEYDGPVPSEWEPILVAELAGLPPLPVDGLPAGVSADDLDSCDRLVDRAVALGPGGLALTLLTAVPTEALSDAARCLALSELTGIAARVEAIRHEFAAAMAGPAPETSEERADDFAAHDVSVAIRASVYCADSMIALSRDLATVLRSSRAAMRRGELTLAQARALHNATAMLAPETARAVESRVLKRASIQSTANFTKSVIRAVATLDPTFAQRCVEARAEVELTHTAFGDGTGQLYIRGPLEVTTTIHMALTAHAVKTKDSLGGTADQRKLAGLRDWAEIDLSSPDTPTHHGRTPTVNVVVELPTLLGLQDHPAEIPGVGPLPADAARWLLVDGAPFRRLAVDPMTGHLLDYGTTTHQVPPALADLLIARNICAASPHTTVDARIADMEHNTPHDQGGATSPVNCTPVDRRWHRAKTHGDWTYTKDPDDEVVTWRSPRGMTCRIEPHDYRLGP